MNLVPQNESFEQAVIVGTLSDPLLIPKISTIVQSEDFYKEHHKEIWRAMTEIEPENLDSLTVENKLQGKEKTLTYFQDLIKDSDKLIANVSNIVFYAETIKGKSKLRAGIDLGREISATCYASDIDPDEALQDLEGMFAKFLQTKVLENTLESTSESFKQFVANLGTKLLEDEGVKSGFIDLDLMLHRLEGLIILAAKTSVGKTAAAINIARSVASTRPVLFFSLEQSREQIFERLLASESEVYLEQVRTGAILEEDKPKIQDAERRLAPIMERLYIDDKANVPASYITSVARQKKYEWGDIGLIVIDYLHIMKLGNKNLVEALGDACKEIRALSKELGCPILLLAQLSRNNDPQGKTNNRRPSLSDLRSSGEIEQTADSVLFLYRESYYQPVGEEDDVAEVIVAKNRQGRTGIVLLDWQPQFVRFKNPMFRKR